MIGFKLSAQELSTLPPSIKWQQIQSEHFKIIYPRGFESEANRTANILENIYEPASRSLGSSPRKFPILLQNHVSIPNGFVTIAPYRSEFYTYSPQSYLSLGNDDWVEHLASHEYRHITQFEKAITPFTMFNYILFGEYGPGFWAALTAPSWFFEGDAVGLETAMGRTGRGRMPEFTMAFKANAVEKGGFNYYKQHLNSYRDFVPNHYVTGYLMTTHLKNEYGPDIWDKIMNNAFRKPFIPLALSNSMKKYTGKRLLATYDEVLEHQKELFDIQLSKFTPSAFTQINTDDRKRFTQYNYPVSMGDQILVVKRGLSDINQLVLIDRDGDEETTHLLGIYNDPSYLSANDSIIVWTEYEFDPRWYNRSYTVIKSFNINTKKLTRLTKKTRYGAAAVSQDSKYIVATHQSENSKFEIHLLSVNGELIKKFENNNNAFYAMPSFDENNNIVLLKHYMEGKQVIIKNISDGDEEVVFYAEEENIGNPILSNGILFYNSNYNGIDNVYAYDLKTKTKYQVTQSKYGAFNASFSTDNQEIVYNDYSVDGMNVVSRPLQKDNWIPIQEVEYIGTDFEKTMIANENIQEVLYDTPDSTYTSKRFRKFAHFFKPFSWSLVPSPWSNTITASLSSQDLVGSTSMRGSVTYNQNENSWRTSANISYQGLYPIIDIGVDNVSRELNYEGVSNEETYLWNENTISLGLRVPLLLTRSKMRQKLDLESSINYTKVSDYNIPFFPQEGDLIALEHAISYSNVMGRSKLDINPRWGYIMSMYLKHAPLGGDYSGGLLVSQALLYAPGIVKHHSSYIRAGFQSQSSENYFFTSPIVYTRGYDYFPYLTYYNVGLNYTFPIAHMDWHIGPIVNLQRIYANVFYDQAFGSTLSTNTDFNSLGTEISFNFNPLRYLVEINAGFRVTYVPEREGTIFEFILGGVSF